MPDEQSTGPKCPTPPTCNRRRPASRSTDPQPLVDCGRFPREAHGRRRVSTCRRRVFRDGHDVLRAVVRCRGPGDAALAGVPLRRSTPRRRRPLGRARSRSTRAGRWQCDDRGVGRPLASWRDELEPQGRRRPGRPRRRAHRGRVLLRGGRRARRGPTTARITGRRDARRPAATRSRVAAALDPELLAAVDRHPDRATRPRSPPLEVDVDRERARFGAWYELFPRSWGGFARRRAGAAAARRARLRRRLPAARSTRSASRNRKGRNNTLDAGPATPAARGRSAGTATAATTPSTPSSARSRSSTALVARRAASTDIDIALDFAIQCSADHPWLTEHPEWFHRRPDGTLKYAENPPKKYQDIYNVNFDCRGLARALGGAAATSSCFWVERGVTRLPRRQPAHQAARRSGSG